MKLLYAPQSPFARKVRIAAIETGLRDRIELEYAEVVPGKPNKSFAQSYNPLRKIPALQRDDGSVLYDSTVICEFLDAEAGDGKIIPLEQEPQWRVLTNHAAKHQGRQRQRGNVVAAREPVAGCIKVGADGGLKAYIRNFKRRFSLVIRFGLFMGEEWFDRHRKLRPLFIQQVMTEILA